VNNFDPNVGDPTFKSYVMACKTKFVTKHINDEIKPGVFNQYTRKMVLLVPEISDQRIRFLNAWMPDTIEEHHELAAEIGAPIHGPVRLAVHRGFDKWCEKPYLLVMSKGTEDILLKFSEGTTVIVKTLSADEEEAADFSRDVSDGNFEIVQE